MSFAEYVAHGWKLCAIEPGQKGPLYKGWNDPAKLAEVSAAAEGLDGAGLAHADSGTCALDIDDLELAKPWLAERGVDIDALMAAPDAVMISSGRPNRGKLLYRIDKPLRTLQPKDSGLELRCATAAGKSVQDALPPTRHPITKKPYEWKYGDPLVAHWSALPFIPSQLRNAWKDLIQEEPDTGDSIPQESDATLDTVRKAIYRYIKDTNKDVADYADWLDVGMRLNEQLGGAEEGIDIWDEWSATDKSLSPNGKPRYQGRDTVRLHYVSFGQGGGRHVGMSHLIAQEPADKEEFGIEQPDEDEADSTDAKMKQTAKQIKADALAKLEQRVVFVDYNEKYFDLKSHRIINTESGLEHKFTHMMPRKKGGKRESPGQLLKESQSRRTVDKVGFHPGEGQVFSDREEYKYVNTYDHERIAKPLEPTSGEVERIEWLFERLDDLEYAIWLKQFYGYAVQRPGAKIRSAPLVWSETQGNGKTTLVRMIPSLLVGGRYSQEVTTTQLDDAFTGFLADKWHLYLGEFRVNSRAEREAIAKKVEKWIADDVITIRPMHTIAYDIPNHLFVTASSNYDDAASISNYDRKWAIKELRAPQFTEAEQEWMYDGFLLTPRAAGVLRYYFQHIDISDFSPSAKAPQTEDRKRMIEVSATSEFDSLETAFDERSGPFARDIVMLSELSEWARQQGNRNASTTRLGIVLAKAPFNGLKRQIRVGDARYWVVIVRNHSKWDLTSGRDMMDHIQGNTLDEEFPDDVDLTA